MHTCTRILLMLAIASIPFAASADDGTTEATVTVGAWGASEDGSPDVVAEYETLADGPVLDLMVASHQPWGSLFVSAEGRDSDDLSSELSFDLKRALRSTTTYDKLFHRLGHDPMTNLEATSTNGKVVFHTDLDPDAAYDLSYGVFHNRTELQLPSFRALTLAVEFREQNREGHRQAFTTSHCDTCHVTSQTHRQDERTTDATLEAKLAWKGGHVRASTTARELRQGISNVTATFDRALHPEQQTPVFDNRLQYDATEGPRIADLWPDQDKSVNRLDLVVNQIGPFAFNAGGVWSETENLYTGLKSDYAGYLANLAGALGSKLRLTWRGRVYAIDNDDVFVDTVERASIAGPQAGRTYEDVYGVSYDWWRLSALDRDVLESRVDLAYRLGGKGGTVKLSWDFEAVDRDTYQVLPGETETTTNLVGLSWRARPAKGWKVDARLNHAEVDNPYMLVNGACSTLVSETVYPNPFNPDAPSYDEQHQLRIAETTASPSNWDEARLGASYTAGPTTFSGSYKWWEGSNRDGDLSDWSRTAQNATLTAWSAPSEQWEWHVAYAWQDQRLDAPVCIPVFDG